jgi:hypothetical protein
MNFRQLDTKRLELGTVTTLSAASDLDPRPAGIGMSLVALDDGDASEGRGVSNTTSGERDAERVGCGGLVGADGTSTAPF